jgi:hypothetical protein
MYNKLSKLILILLFVSNLGLSEFSYSQENLSISYISDKGIDNDQDGLYDYIQVTLEVYVPVDGIYVVETSEMRDTNEQMIPVQAFQRLALEQGEHVITITFDGRRIRTSGKNPAGFSFINFIKIDYSDADFLNDVELLNEYSYLDFEEPPVYDIGVSQGDSVFYNVNEYHTPPLGENSTELEGIQWIVEDVQGALLYLEMDLLYSDNSADKEYLDGYLEKESHIFPFLIPSSLELGDSFGEQELITLNRSRTQEMMGYNKTIYIYREKRVINQTNIDYVFDQDYQWDKETGILIESWFNTTTVSKVTGNENKNNVLIQLYATSLFKEKTELTLRVDYGDFTRLTGLLVDSKNEGIPEQEILLTKTGGETDKYTTNSTGYFEANLENTGGDVLAEYLGSVRYSPTETEIYVEPGKNDNSTLMVTGIILVVLAVSILFILRKFSII